jgi:hypothetical protein
MRKTKLVKKINHTHRDVKTNGEAKNGLIRQKRERKNCYKDKGELIKTNENELKQKKHKNCKSVKIAFSHSVFFFGHLQKLKKLFYDLVQSKI